VAAARRILLFSKAIASGGGVGCPSPGEKIVNGEGAFFLYENEVDLDCSEPVPSECITSFGCEAQGNPINVIYVHILYSDTTYSTKTFNPTAEWGPVSFSASEGKKVIGISFFGPSGSPCYVRNVSLIV
jgi:hypothetical protein